VSALAAQSGWASRRSGPAVAIMRADRLAIGQLDGKVPEGVRRPASLEDAFVMLTGEEIE
jgi:lipooligosaccharide transport system ATP-binding protein